MSRWTIAWAALAIVLSAPGLGCDVETTEGELPISRPEVSWWRRPQRDGLNCLYVQAKSRGLQVNYHQLVNMARTARSLEELSQVADRINCPSTVATLTVDQLHSINSPTIVHLEDFRSGGGSFGLYITSDRSGNFVYLVDGVGMSFQRLSIDEFRRRWTGVAFVERRRTRYLSILAAGGGFVIGWYVIFSIPQANELHRRIG